MPERLLLLIADDPSLSEAIQARVREAADPAMVCSLDPAGRHLHDSDSLVLCAVAAPADFDAIRHLLERMPDQDRTPVVLVQAAKTDPPEPGADEAPVIHRLHWPQDADRLRTMLQATLDRRPRLVLHREDTTRDKISRRLLAHTPSLMPLADHIALAGEHDVTVLFSGETGTGKSYLAKLLHDCSARREHPFLTVPCGALPNSLVESAFFGHVKGAFTGADLNQEGKFAAAGKGTLLLDEIDTLSLERQASLLRVIETGEYEPVGSNRTCRCQARLLVASNWDLEEAVRRGQFRQDLYYRLNVMSFYLPPLRERVQDIGPLAQAFVGRFNEKFGKEVAILSPEALTLLEAFPWPGNIRQLENVVQAAMLACTGAELLAEHLPPALRTLPVVQKIEHHRAAETLADNRDQHERDHILRVLESCGHNLARAARVLGVSRVTMYKKLKKYGLRQDRLSAS